MLESKLDFNAAEFLEKHQFYILRGCMVFQQKTATNISLYCQIGTRTIDKADKLIKVVLFHTKSRLQLDG